MRLAPVPASSRPSSTFYPMLLVPGRREDPRVGREGERGRRRRGPQRDADEVRRHRHVFQAHPPGACRLFMWLHYCVGHQDFSAWLEYHLEPFGILTPAPLFTRIVLCNLSVFLQQKDFFSKMVVDAVTMLDELLPLNMIGIKKVQGGSLEETVLVTWSTIFSSSCTRSSYQYNV